MLGCHPNTVRSRVKAGMYRAEKFHTENGPTWMIERGSLINNAPTSARQQAVSGVPVAHQVAIQELAKAIVREAGLHQPSGPGEAWIEGEKLEHETAKTQTVITTTLLGASGAAWFIQDPKHVWLLGLALVLGITSLGFALNHMNAIATDLRRQPDRTWSAWRRFLLRDGATLLSAALFTVATFCLSVYLIFNI